MRRMTNTTTNEVPESDQCCFCGKTNSAGTICGGCFGEQRQTSDATSGAASGLIEVNRHHECFRCKHTIDIALVCAVAGVIAIGCSAALIKNRKRKTASNQSTHGTR
jgi:hypothetical protein